MESTREVEMSVPGHASHAEAIQSLSRTHNILCREAQIGKLISFFGKPHQSTPGSLFIYGHTSCGKSLTVQSFFTHFKLPHVIINCIECVSKRFLMEHILMNIQAIVKKNSPTKARAKERRMSEGVSGDSVTCGGMTDFIRILTEFISNSHLRDETFYLVFDKAERLRDAYSSLLPALLRLQELTSLNICTIFISEVIWEKFHSGTGFWEPICIHFPGYSKKQLHTILCLDCPTDCDIDIYSQYVNIVLSVFSVLCHDLKELRHLIKLNLAYFMEPIKSGEVTIAEPRKLWRNIEPHLKRSLESVYLREVSSHQWELMQQAYFNNTDSEDVKPTSSRVHVELPYYSKFLLIAAYLASYNPMKYDKRFFAKHSGRVSKRAKLVKKNERTSSHLLGPKVFPLDRLMAIFYSIVEGKVIPSALITTQISSLVSLHLLSQSGGDDKISSPKYKCMVSLDFIQSVARTVQFEVMIYLYDFL